MPSAKSPPCALSITSQLYRVCMAHVHSTKPSFSDYQSRRSSTKQRFVWNSTINAHSTDQSSSLCSSLTAAHVALPTVLLR